MKKRILSIALALTLALSLLPAAAFAKSADITMNIDDGSISVAYSGSGERIDVTQGGASENLKAGAKLTVTGGTSEAPSANGITIDVPGQTMNLAIKDLYITNSFNCINIKSGTVNLTLTGSSELRSNADEKATLRIAPDAALIITQESTGDADIRFFKGTKTDGNEGFVGGNIGGAAAIGADWSGLMGTLTVNGGTVYADCARGTAIGNGFATSQQPATGSVTINGGRVDAHSWSASGLGGRSSYIAPLGELKINGGTVAAFSYDMSALAVVPDMGGYAGGHITMGSTSQNCTPVIDYAPAENAGYHYFVAATHWADAADTGWYNEQDPQFTLNTPAQLAGLAKLVNDGNGFYEKTITLGGDINLDGALWTPIGSAEYSFSGTFDGGDYTVSAMTVDGESSDGGNQYLGLFGACDNAEIRNIKLSGSIERTESGGIYAGGVTGYANMTHIEDCSSCVAVIIAADTAYAGGIAGYMQGENLKTIVGCSNSGSVAAAGAVTAYAGGIAGYVNNDRVYNSCNTGCVSAAGAADTYVGGIAGGIEKTLGGRAYIANCYNRGEVTNRNNTYSTNDLVGIQTETIVYNSYGYCDSLNENNVQYYDGRGTASDITVDEIKALGNTLNQWVNDPAVTLGQGETPFAQWYTSDLINDGCPAFDRTYLVTLAGVSDHARSDGEYVPGNPVTINAGTVTGYRFAGWTVTKGDAQLNDPLAASTSFTMPESDVTLTANWRIICYSAPEITPEPVTYTITTGGEKGGTVSPAGSATVKAGESKTVSVIPGDGYKIYDVLIDGASVGAVPEYTFEKADRNHTVSALFARIFSDVAVQWFAPGVDYASAHSLMDGVGGGEFAPEQETTRGMIVTILWRLEGQPQAEKAMTFTDVPEDSYCRAAVAWAAENGVVLGFSDEEFRPEQIITREQLAAVLFRYAVYKGYDVSVGQDTNILSYGDAGSISEYAVPAMQWAVGAGLIDGDGQNLAPASPATRAQLAAILQRFIVGAAK